MQIKDNTFTSAKLQIITSRKAKKKTVATQTGSCDFLRKTRLDAHNHYFDKVKFAGNSVDSTGTAL